LASSLPRGRWHVRCFHGDGVSAFSLALAALADLAPPHKAFVDV